MTRSDLRDIFERSTLSRGFTAACGFRIRDFRDGFVAMEAAPREDLLQFSGYVHAGVVTALADHAAGAAYASALPEGRACLTIELKINFMKPAVGDLIVAEATVISPGKSVGVVRSDVFAEKEGGRTHIAAALVSLKSVEFAQAS